MSKIEELKPIPLAKGVDLHIFIDHSQPLDSIERHWTEVVYDGEPGSQVFEAFPHWHKYHDEIMVVKEGELDIMIEGVTTRYKASTERITIPRWQVHGIKAVPGVRAVLQERTNPTGEFKEWFFRDLFKFGNPPSFLHVLRASWDGDTWLALPVGGKFVDQLFMYMAGPFARLVCPPKKPLEYER